MRTEGVCKTCGNEYAQGGSDPQLRTDQCMRCELEELRDAHALPWAVLVLCSGGWNVLGRFVDEGATWHYAGTQLEARVIHDGECIAHKDGYQEPWHDCDQSGPCAPVPERQIREADGG